MSWNVTYNYSSYGDMAREVALNSPELVGMVLLFIFAIIFISGFSYSRRNQTAKGGITWFVVAGFITSTIATFLYLVEDVVPSEILLACYGVTFASILLWFLSDDDGY